MKKILLALFILIGTFTFTAVAVAQKDQAVPPPKDQAVPPPKCPGGEVPPCKSTVTKNDSAKFDLNIKLKNPLKVDNIQDAIKYFMNVLIKIALPFIVLFFLWSGLKFILAQGNATKITEARKMFWYTIIGTLLILGAWTITNAIIGTVNSLVG